MKRFWKNAEAVAVEDGWGVTLDGKPLRTPARTILALPFEALARAIATEWNDAGETVDPRAMPLTGLANAAIDRVAPDKCAFAATLARYAETDLACYRADSPPELVRRQAERWDPLLGWARRRYDVDFAVTNGVMHVPQPKATVDRLGHAVAALDTFRLAGLAPLVSIGGSLAAALAVLDRGIEAADAWLAVSVDERWQLEQWGSDAEAEQALDNRRRDFMAAASFLQLLDP
jgi:chaperone required for assembly of F1-ATPase